MINITKLGSGAVLLQKDSTEIVIDQAAITSALPAVIHTLLTTPAALAQARREGYEAGLVQGRIQARIEAETAQRIAARQESEMIEALVGCAVASAA